MHIKESLALTARVRDPIRAEMADLARTSGAPSVPQHIPQPNSVTSGLRTLSIPGPQMDLIQQQPLAWTFGDFSQPAAAAPTPEPNAVSSAITLTPSTTWPTLSGSAPSLVGPRSHPQSLSSHHPPHLRGSVNAPGSARRPWTMADAIVHDRITQSQRERRVEKAPRQPRHCAKCGSMTCPGRQKSENCKGICQGCHNARCPGPKACGTLNEIRARQKREKRHRENQLQT